MQVRYCVGERPSIGKGLPALIQELHYRGCEVLLLGMLAVACGCATTSQPPSTNGSTGQTAEPPTTTARAGSVGGSSGGVANGSMPPTGPGWQATNVSQAFSYQNRHGQNLFRRKHRSKLLQADSGLGMGNYLLTVPLLHLAGRGTDITLNLYYNSQLWTKIVTASTIKTPPGYQGPPPPGPTYMVFDHDRGWPAPGWSLGFGRILNMGGCPSLQDPDGAIHPFNYAAASGCTNHSTDGTLIDWAIDLAAGKGQVKYPNGTTIDYGAPARPTPDFIPQALYPLKITDRNGNFITISYLNGVGPWISTITDTLGRRIQFVYGASVGSEGLVPSAITAPDVNGGTRTVVMFNYRSVRLQPTFGSTTDPLQPIRAIDAAGRPITLTPTVPALEAISFPGSSTGYWFGDPDSYSGFGMIAKVSERRGLTLTTAGQVTLEEVYNYPNVGSAAPTTIDDIPTYTQMTRTWANMDSSPAVTTYAGVRDGPITTTYPDGSQVTSANYVWQLPGQAYLDGLPRQSTTRDSSGRVLAQQTTTWESGDYDSPRVKSVETMDELGQTLTTAYGYTGPTNQLSDTRFIDYDGSTVLRHTMTTYEPDTTGMASRHIFHMPKQVLVVESSGATLSRTEYEHDRYAEYPLQLTPGIIGLSDEMNLGTAAGATLNQTNRGNVTKITRYVDAASSAGPITTLFGYDDAGNVVDSGGTCCVHVHYAFSVATQYAFPDSVVSGNPSADHVSQAFTYDVGTGLVVGASDANGNKTAYEYEPSTLRPTRIGQATGAFQAFSYDDQQLISTTIVGTPVPPPCVPVNRWGCATTVLAESVLHLNGLGEAQRLDTLADDSVWNAVVTQYDSLGRAARISQPYQLQAGAGPVGTPQYWTTYSYDLLGRMISVQAPDGAITKMAYDGQRPPAASNTPGETEWVTLPYGGDRWYRRDALGELVEVLEPPAYVSGANGSVAEDGVAATAYGHTRYTYNGTGQLVQVLQGAQQRQFQYDSLGRLTAEKVPERAATLDDAGEYLGPGGRWSDFYAYNNQSNLISHTDARGIVASFDYVGDPLDRLRAISYGSAPGRLDDGSIDPSPSTNFTYMPTGDLTRLSKLSMVNGSDAAWRVRVLGYDPLGRHDSTILQDRNLPALEVDYRYDTLNRLGTETYPAEVGVGAQSRRTVAYSYGVGGAARRVQVDGVDYFSAPQFNAARQLTSASIGPGGPSQTTEHYVYDPVIGLLTSQQVQQGPTTLLNISYTYLPNRKLHQLIESVGAPAEYDYTYDALGRLWNMQKAAGADGPAWSESYSCDIYGNLTGVAPAGQVHGVAAPADGLVARTYDASTNHISTAGFSYDAAGNLLRARRADGTWARYRYDQAGKLTQVTDDVGHVVEAYTYGPQGERVTTTTSSSYIYSVQDTHGAIAQYRASSASAPMKWLQSRIYDGSRLLATMSAGGSGQLISYHHPDRLGSRLVTNSAGGALETTTLPFGTQFPSQPKALNPIFTSYERSTASGLDYAVNRDYDPAIGRFIQTDPRGIAAASLSNPQSLNLYAYVQNDPVNSIDLTGLDPLQVAGVNVDSCNQNDDGSKTCSGGDLDPGEALTIDATGNVFLNGELIGGPNQLAADTIVVENPPPIGISADIGAAALVPGIEFQNLLTSTFGMAQNGIKLFSSIANTVPDLLNLEQAIGEIKFVQYIYGTSQLGAQFEVALTQGIRYYLFVAPETQVAEAVTSAVESTGGRVISFDALTGTLRDASTGLELSAEEAWNAIEPFTTAPMQIFMVTDPTSRGFRLNPTPDDAWL